MWLAYKQTDSCQIQFIEAVDAVLEHLRNSVCSTHMFLETFAPKPSSTGRLSCRRYVTLPFFLRYFFGCRMDNCIKFNHISSNGAAVSMRTEECKVRASVSITRSSGSATTSCRGYIRDENER